MFSPSFSETKNLYLFDTPQKSAQDWYRIVWLRERTHSAHKLLTVATWLIFILQTLGDTGGLSNSQNCNKTKCIKRHLVKCLQSYFHQPCGTTPFVKQIVVTTTGWNQVLPTTAPLQTARWDAALGRTIARRPSETCSGAVTSWVVSFGKWYQMIECNKKGEKKETSHEQFYWILGTIFPTAHSCQQCVIIAKKKKRRRSIASKRSSMKYHWYWSMDRLSCFLESSQEKSRSQKSTFLVFANQIYGQNIKTILGVPGEGDGLPEPEFSSWPVFDQ